MSADPRLRSTDELTLVGTIVTAHRAPFRGVVTVRDGVIAAVSDQPGDGLAGHQIDVRDRFILPGFVDVHVHSSSLGAEGLARATAAAAVGGVTTMIDMQFLYREAALLDAWRLEEWLALYADDASYVIPATTSDAGRDSDDRARLAGRVKRLLSTHAHANNPRTRHIVANVKAQPADGGAMSVYANFVIYSMRNRQTNLYLGEYRYRLRSVAGGGFLIEEKRAILDMETLDPAGGKINIVI